MPDGVFLDGEQMTPPPAPEVVPPDTLFHVVIVAHNADTLALVAKANESNADEVEIDVSTILEPTAILGKPVAVGLHGMTLPTRQYDTVEDLVANIKPEKRAVLDLKVHPDFPGEEDRARRLLEHVEYLLPKFYEQGRLNIAFTGGNDEIMDSLSKTHPELELRWTVSSEEDYERLMRRGDQIKAMSVKASVLKKLGIEAFGGKKLYVYGIPLDEEDEIRELGVAGIITDSYKNYIIEPAQGIPLD